jgi:hypothetical protein
MNKIKTNDPNFTTLDIGVTYEGLGEGYIYIPPANPTFPGGDGKVWDKLLVGANISQNYHFMSIRGVISSTLLPPREYY